MLIEEYGHQYIIIPPHAPDLIAKLIRWCWSIDPDERPKFAKILVYLKTKTSPGEAENEEWMSDETLILENDNQLSKSN